MDTTYKQRTFSLQFVIIEKLRKNLSPKGNIYTWELETDRIDCQGWEHGGRVRGRVGEEEEGRGAGERRTCRNGIGEMEKGQR